MGQGEARQEAGRDAAAVAGDDADFDATRPQLVEQGVRAGQESGVRAAGDLHVFQHGERPPAEGRAVATSRRDVPGGGLHHAQNVLAGNNLVRHLRLPGHLLHGAGHGRESQYASR